LIITKLLAFLWRDWEQARSYKLAFLLQLAGYALPLALLYFLGRLFDQVDLAALSQYGGSYVTFVLVGIIVTTLAGTSLRSFSSSLRTAQQMGTLEVLLLTRASLPTILLGWAMYPMVRAIVAVAVFLAAGFLFLGLRLDNANLVGALLVLVLTVIVMGGLGLAAASFTLVFKQGDPFTFIVVVASGMLSGALYPVSVMPGWLQAVAQLLPHTHAISAMRAAALQGYSLGDMAPQLGILVIYAVLAVPLGLWIFNRAMRRAKVDGSLAQY
jgi:ABC-2 type transport system permease protein